MDAYATDEFVPLLMNHGEFEFDSRVDFDMGLGPPQELSSFVLGVGSPGHVTDDVKVSGISMHCLEVIVTEVSEG
jgi:hypothetical protein